jgi:hypothetical protein
VVISAIHPNDIYISKIGSSFRYQGEQNHEECEDQMDIHVGALEMDHAKISPFVCSDANRLQLYPSCEGIVYQPIFSPRICRSN